MGVTVFFLIVALTVSFSEEPMIKFINFNDVMLTTNFNLQEFCDSRTGEVKIYMPLVEKLQAIRTVVGWPIKVTSGYRTKETNEKVDGAHPNSAHLYGMAVDVVVKFGDHRAVANLARRLHIPEIIIYEAGEGSVTGHVHLAFNELPPG